jgi:hypothetical protein
MLFKTSVGATNTQQNNFDHILVAFSFPIRDSLFDTMTRSSLCLLPLCLALVVNIPSACGFAPRARVLKSTHLHTVLASTRSSVIHDKDQEETLLKHYRLTPKITTVNSMDDFITFLGEDERLCVVK